jgi:cardiolipin synthase A/B
MMGEPIPELEVVGGDAAVSAGDMDVRIVASLPATAGMIRLDELVAALARRRLWLTDAYFAGTSSYVQEIGTMRSHAAQGPQAVLKKSAFRTVSQGQET